MVVRLMVGKEEVPTPFPNDLMICCLILHVGIAESVVVPRYVKCTYCLFYIGGGERSNKCNGFRQKNTSEISQIQMVPEGGQSATYLWSTSKNLRFFNIYSCIDMFCCIDSIMIHISI